MRHLGGSRGSCHQRGGGAGWPQAADALLWVPSAVPQIPSCLAQQTVPLMLNPPNKHWAPTPARTLCSAASLCPNHSGTAAVVSLTRMLAKLAPLNTHTGLITRTQAEMGGPQRSSAPATHLQNGDQVPLPLPHWQGQGWHQGPRFIHGVVWLLSLQWSVWARTGQ